MKAALVVGVILIGLGILTLAYFASPVRFLVQRSVGAPVNLALPIVGVTALLLGVVLLIFVRPKIFNHK
jgi:hypothetical protein